MQATRKPRSPIADRLHAKLVPMSNGCIEFTGNRYRTGYGKLRVGPKGAGVVLPARVASLDAWRWAGLRVRVGHGAVLGVRHMVR